MPRRHVPLRTCVACRQSRPKREMVRIVRTLAGPVEVDPTGKRSGRGAYLCRSRSCWDAGLRRGVLSRALKTELTADDLARLEAFAATLGEESSSAPAPGREADPAEP